MSDDLAALERDLGTIPYHSGRFVKAALSKTAYDAKEAWRGHAGGRSGSRARHYPGRIDYDVEGTFPSFEASIGPTPAGRVGKGNGHQGSLGILEDAPGGVRSAPQRARPKVVREITGDFEKGLDRAVDDAFVEAGGPVMWEALRALLATDPALDAMIEDTARLDGDGKLVRANYVILGRAGPSDLDDDRYASIQRPESDATFDVPLKVVAQDPAGVEAIAGRVSRALVGRKPVITGRRCDPVELDFDPVKADTSVSPPMFYMDMWATTTSRRA